MNSNSENSENGQDSNSTASHAEERNDATSDSRPRSLSTVSFRTASAASVNPVNVSAELSVPTAAERSPGAGEKGDNAGQDTSSDESEKRYDGPDTLGKGKWRETEDEVGSGSTDGEGRGMWQVGDSSDSRSEPFNHSSDGSDRNVSSAIVAPLPGAGTSLKRNYGTLSLLSQGLEAYRQTSDETGTSQDMQNPSGWPHDAASASRQKLCSNVSPPRTRDGALESHCSDGTESDDDWVSIPDEEDLVMPEEPWWRRMLKHLRLLGAAEAVRGTYQRVSRWLSDQWKGRGKRIRRWLRKQRE